MPKIDHLPPQALKPWPGNARRHSRKQIRQLIDSIRRFGFTSPVVIDDAGHILAGHGRAQAACALGLPEVPCHRLDHLSETEKRAYVIADNKLALNATWDRKLLAQELSHFRVREIDFDVGVIGFSTGEMEGLFGTASADEGSDRADDENHARVETHDEIPRVKRCAHGDVWQLGPHRLVCSRKLNGPVFEGWPGGCTEQMIVMAPGDSHADDVSHSNQWNTDTLLAADRAQKLIVLAEPDLAKCERMLARWEAHARAPATRLRRPTGHGHDGPEDSR
ncbi:ParB/Srx family N-terminal domain-containing protein [Taklimakanibacter deserti]|uniref:ParB/Srx family N-terminal domain-containing protein n=1 Tax=Taklimakanibacter deserti TaxID=2267839 RepID=UPI0034D62196